MKGRGKHHKNIVYRPQQIPSQPAPAQLAEAPPVVFIKQEDNSDNLVYSLPEPSSTAAGLLASQRLSSSSIATPTLPTPKGENVHTLPDSLRGNLFAVPSRHGVGGVDWSAVVKKEPPDEAEMPSSFQELPTSSSRNSVASHKGGHFRGRGRGSRRSGFKTKQ